MMEKVKITNWQASLLIVSTIFPTAVLTVPKVVGKYSLQAAWLSIVFAACFSFVVSYVATALCTRYREKTIFEIISALLGGTVSKLIGILLSFYYFSVFFYVLYQFSDFMTTSVMDETPPWAFHLILALQAGYAVYIGLEGMARTNSLVISYALLAFLCSAVLIIKDVDWTHFLPVIEVPLSNIILGAYTPAGWLSEVAVIWLLAPYIKETKKLQQTAFWGVALTASLLLLTLLGTLFIYGPHYILFLKYPTFTVFREIQVAEIFQRIDILFIAIWIGTMVMKAAMFLFGAVYCFCEPFRVRQRGFILIPFILLGFLYANVSWHNSQHLDEYGTYTFPAFVFLFNIILPLLLLVLAFVRKRSADNPQLGDSS